MVLRNLRIGTRLALGFGAILAIMLVLSLGATALGKGSRDELARIVQAANAKESLAADMKAVLLEQSNAMRSIGLLTEIRDMQVAEDRANALGRAFDESIDRMAKLVQSPQEREVLETLRKLDKDIQGPLGQAMGLSTSFQNEAANKVLLNELDPVVQKILGHLNRLIDLQKQANRNAIDAAVAMGDRIAMGTYVAQAVVLVLAVLLAWLTTRSITGPINESVQVARRVAAGDLTTRVDPRGRDEAAALLASLRDMNDGLGRMVSRIRTGAESIAVGANQVAAGNQQLSSRTEEHASSLEETASTLEEFTTTVRQNAEHARQASALAGSASTTAERGGEVVGRVVTTMQEVATSSRKITDIIGVIDGISFQTNILALNAAVEAARAGEQGRGFAVVASEVRSLAQRSASSAKEIRTLIEESVSRVENGAKLVEQAGRTMDELVESVRKVAAIMTEIAAASHEQSSGIEQINRAITQMDQVVQMNASLVEEATAAATSMASQATGLAQAVAQFRVQEGLEPQEAAQRPHAPALAAASGRALEERRAASVPARREPMLATGDDDWKEF